MKEALVREAVSIVSPLRYPGGKRRLTGYIADCLKLNGLKPKLFVEPFAGGASVALQLLAEERVDAIALGDRDQLVASFWRVVFWDSEWLVKRIKGMAVTVRNWKHFRTHSWRSDRDRALACLFLNRTSFSGILAATAGPIGGKEQDSDYLIDCRFPVKTLARRIKQAAELKDKVLFVNSRDWKNTIKRVKALDYKKNEVFYYLDPPFYAKAERLYQFYFKDADHNALHDELGDLAQPWLLSYDVAQEILDKYSHNSRGPKRIDLLYSIKGSSGLSQTQEIIITNLGKLPRKTRLWRSSHEWRA